MRDIRLGVAGAGYWGPNLIRNCHDLGVLDSVCDVNSVALEAVKSTYPEVHTIVSFEELLQRPIDGVIIATPAQLHARMCEQALAAEKHVLVEKPLALNLADGQRVVEAAEKNGLIVLVGHVLLYHDAVKRMLALLTEGVVGQIQHFRSRRLSLGRLRDHENVWWSFAPHDVALMLAVMGEGIHSVHASQTEFLKPGISDVAYADFTFSENRSAHIEVCWADPKKQSRTDVFGSRGILTFEDSRSGASLTIHKFKVVEKEGRRQIVREDVREVAVEQTEPLRAELNAFMEAIASGKPPVTSARSGIAVLKALLMADEASRDLVKARVLA